jgi:hypothetical protein
MRRRLDPAIAAAVAAATNFFYYFQCEADWFFPDSYTYLAPARNLLRGLGFVAEPGLPETLRTPGYPLILAAFGTRVDPVIFAQHLVNVLVAAGIVIFARRHAGRFTALAAGLIFAVDIPTVHYANKVLTETFFTGLLFVVFVMVVEAGCSVPGSLGSLATQQPSNRATQQPSNPATQQPSNPATQQPALPLAGILTGLLVLIRPVAIGYFVVAAAILIMRGVRRREIALFVALALLPPLAWGVRNWGQSGVFTVSSIGDINLLTYRAAAALALERGGDFAKSLEIEQARLNAIADREIMAGEDLDDPKDADPAVGAVYRGRVGRRVLLQHPRSAAELTVRGLAVNVFDSRWDALLEPFDDPPERFFRVAATIWTFALFLLAFIGAVALWRANRPFAVALVATFLYFVFISAGGESESRFRVPVIPQYAILAGAGLAAIARRPV